MIYDFANDKRTLETPPYGEFSILNPQFSILNPQFSILKSQFSNLNSQISILNPQSFLAVLSSPQAAKMSWPRDALMVVKMPCDVR